MEEEKRDAERAADYRLMMGDEAGRLALVLDHLTDVMALIAQHKVYCRVEKGPRSGEGGLDVESALILLGQCKQLVRETIGSLGSKRS